MIDLVFQAVKTIMNKEIRGNITPSEFNLVSNIAQNKIFRDYFLDLPKDQHKYNRGFGGKGLANLPLKTRQKIDLFSDTKGLVYDTDRFVLPTDLYWIKDRGIKYGNNVIDEGQVSRSAFKGSSKTSASTTFPQYHREGSNITVSPDTIIDNVTCSYIRLPKSPKWTYQKVLGVEMFDPGASDYQDFELHNSEVDNLVVEILSNFGINLREIDVTQILQQIKSNEDAQNK